MGQEALSEMLSTGVVQYKRGDVSFVSNPADINVYQSQAKPGSVYAEYGVPTNSLHPASYPASSMIPASYSAYGIRMAKLGCAPYDDVAVTKLESLEGNEQVH